MKIKSLESAHSAVTMLAVHLKCADVGPVAGDVEKLARWMVRMLNNDGEMEIARLSKIADALS